MIFWKLNEYKNKKRNFFPWKYINKKIEKDFFFTKAKSTHFINNDALANK